MTGLISGYAVAKLLHVIPSLCPTICPVTPASVFQFGWAVEGVEDGAINATIPQPPLGPTEP